jgi:GntR family transcriptional repressor for pyruvate dehydrogenase complex
LNVSRPSLREALIRLESDGFIRAAGRGGFVVSDVTAPLVSHPLAALLEQQPNASADVLELRHGLETLSTAYAAERATDADIARIAAAFDALQTAVADKSTRIAEKDAAFHLAIADATHNVALTHVMHGLNELVRESMLTSHRLVDYDDEVEANLMTQHRAIFDAIVARDPARARECAGAHLDYVRTLYAGFAAKRNHVA